MKNQPKFGVLLQLPYFTIYSLNGFIILIFFLIIEIFMNLSMYNIIPEFNKSLSSNLKKKLTKSMSQLHLISE